MPTIIVATDCSAAATNAAHYAAHLAETIQADLLLMAVVTYNWVSSEIPTPGLYDIEIQNTRTQLEELKSTLHTLTGQALTITTSVTIGAVVDEIKNLAEVHKPFAIVMGITGAGRAERTLFGSNTYNALHHLFFPVIVVPPTATYQPIRHIGLATDLMDVAQTIDTAEIKDLVTRFGTTLQVLHVTHPDGITSGLALPGAKNLQEALRPVHPEFHYQRAGNITDGVLQFIHDQNIQLLLTIPKHRGLFQSIFHQSASGNIAAHITIPMMTVHK